MKKPIHSGKQQQQTTEQQQTTDRQRQQIEFEEAAISIEDFMVVSLVQYFVNLSGGDFSRWGSGIWTDRSLMGDPSVIQLV